MRTLGERLLPHYAYIEAVERALAERRIPPVRWWVYTAARPGQRAAGPAAVRMCALLDWRTAPARASGTAGMSWHWSEDFGWRYALTDAASRRQPGAVRALELPVYAAPTVLAAAAHALAPGAPGPRD